jgi:hypothetical protein
MVMFSFARVLHYKIKKRFQNTYFYINHDGDQSVYSLTHLFSCK